FAAGLGGGSTVGSGEGVHHEGPLARKPTGQPTGTAPWRHALAGLVVGARSHSMRAGLGWQGCGRWRGGPGLRRGGGQDRFCPVRVAAVGGWEGAGAVAGQSELSFAGLLRQLRAEARLTQEELAEAATVSPRSVSDLERGINRNPHKDTAVLLAGALGLTGPAEELFVAAARGKVPAAQVLAAAGSAGPRPGVVTG